jgi:predicted small integral membrane protein
MQKRFFRNGFAHLAWMGLAFFQSVASADGLPRVWMAYDGNSNVSLFEADVADLMAHGVGAMSIAGAIPKTNVLAIARKTGMKFFTGLPGVS